jgi:hypothetical protein
MMRAGNPNWRGRVSTIDLLAPTSSVKLLLALKVFIFFFTKQVILMRKLTILSLPF